MSIFAELRTQFDVNWMTLVVGWDGLAAFSQLPDPSNASPPLLSADEVFSFANNRMELSASSSAEEGLVASLLSLDPRAASLEEIRTPLARLATLTKGDWAVELRKWRLVLLEGVLQTLPDDAIYGLIALTEFWQQLDYPADSPHVVQGRGNEIPPADYYQKDNFDRLLTRHQIWVDKERAIISQYDLEVKARSE
jgi:hypothetical protein